MRERPTPVLVPRKIGAKFLGGFVPAVAYHFGVLEILEERGFVLRRGFRAPDEPRVTGPPGIDLVTGSSAGAFFVVAACAGARRDELVGAVEEGQSRLAPFEARLLGQSKGLTQKLREWAREGGRPRWKFRRTWKSWAAESTLDALFPLWTLDSIERYLAEEILKGREWEDLRTEAAVLAVDLNHPVTYILGERRSPILDLFDAHPARPETIHRILGSEAYKIADAMEKAGVARDHPVLIELREEPYRRHTSVYLRGVPMANAAAGSMATYPFYAPVPLRSRNGKPFHLGHYPVVVTDGEDRNPFTTDVAEEAGCDLVIVSSISAPYKFLHGLGSLDVRGYGAIHQQKSHQARDAKQEDVTRTHAVQRQLYEASRRILEDGGAPAEALARLRRAFQRLAWIDHQRIRISPDPDIASENRTLTMLEPLTFTPQAVGRAMALGRAVARRVLARYVFEFLD
jgi:predicted acylesterase/phospholipase RssA